MSNFLRCRDDELEQRVSSLIDERKGLERKVKTMQKASAFAEFESIMENVKEIDGVRVATHIVSVNSIDELRTLGDRLREQLKSGVGVLGTVVGEKVHFLSVVTDDVIQDRGLKAGDIVRKIAEIAGGSGGGKPHQALAGGKDKSKVQEALNSTLKIVKDLLE